MNNYSPSSISEIIIGSVDGDFIVRSIISGDIEFPLAGKSGFLLHGAFGTGKSTLARLLPVEIERKRGNADPLVGIHLVENDGKLNGKIIKNVAVSSSLVPIFGSFNHVVIDEIDLLSSAHQKTLRNIMDQPNNIFYFTTNALDRVDRGIQSRCHLIEMNAAPSQAWVKLFSKVLVDRGASVPPESMMLPIIEECEGSVRDIITAAQVLAAKRVANGLTFQAAAEVIDAEQLAA